MQKKGVGAGVLVRGISHESLSMAASLAYFATMYMLKCHVLLLTSSSMTSSSASGQFQEVSSSVITQGDDEREPLCVASRMDEL